MIKFFSAAEVHAALDLPSLADAIAAMFASNAYSPQRHVHRLAATAGDDDSLLLMPAWNDTALAVKLVTVMPRNASQGAATVQSLLVLLDRHSGQPLALIDGEALTLRRTAAASLLAARYLAAPQVNTVLIIGTGALAPYMARAHALHAGVQRVLIWGRRADHAQRMAQRLRDEGIAAQAVDDLQQAALRSQLISCATTATSAVLHGPCVAPGTHVDLVGGFRPDMREADDALITAARIWVDTRSGALAEAGDLVDPMARGVLHANAVVGELADLVRGGRGRSSAQDVTLFKSVGCALEDLAAASLLLSRR